MGKDLENIFRKLKDDVSSYTELKLELLKINTYERIGRVIALISYWFLLSVLVLIPLLFAMLALSFLFNRWLDSSVAGFGIVAVLYLILVIIVILNKKRIYLKVINVIISTLITPDEKNDTTNAAPDSPAEPTDDAH